MYNEITFGSREIRIRVIESVSKSLKFSSQALQKKSLLKTEINGKNWQIGREVCHRETTASIFDNGETWANAIFYSSYHASYFAFFPSSDSYFDENICSLIKKKCRVEMVCVKQFWINRLLNVWK